MPTAPSLESAAAPRPVPVRPELLAPAGDWECAKAAVENGADAIYFGLERFNARMRAKNFTVADLPKLMEFLHRRGVRGYVTFNTLVFADELAATVDYLKAIITAGVDAAIVQDVGICRLIRSLSPDFPIHTSTQMTVTSAAGVEFARELGAHLVVLARENSLKEIAAIRDAQLAAGTALPLEVFVHGALCVAYSGQCLTSESLGGRSANRGECAQACRMPYELVSDGQKVDLGDRRYLLSPQDLSGLDVLPDLVRSGVASLKIEGRLKSPEYVANITRVYRQALDKVMAEVFGPTPAPEAAVMAGVRKESLYDLEMGFSRGLYTGWFRGIQNQELAHARFGTKRGVYLGQVTRLSADSVTLKLTAPAKPGDGIVFDAGRPDEREEGGRIYYVDQHGGETTLRFGRGDIDFARIHVGDRIWKTNDPELDRRVRATFEGDQIRFRREIHLEVHGAAGTPLTLFARDEQGHVTKAGSTLPLARAEKQPLTTERLTDQLGRLGGTPFRLGTLQNHLEGDVILPVKELNELRRRTATELEAQRAVPPRWQFPENFSPPAFPAAPAVTAAELIVVIREPHQLEAAWAAGARTFYCEFENPKHYRDTVVRFRALQGDQPTASIWVAAPRVFKPGEEWIIKQVLSCEADGYLVRNYDHLKAFAGRRLRGDFSLNVANPLTADYFVNHHGLERVTASYDLNIGQLEALLQNAPGTWFDITLHQHMPMFHMEHCVFCAFLSTGKDYRDCGRPCDTHRVALRDRVGAEHPLKADAGCRNTVYNSRAQTGAEYAARLMALGARSFRVEFLTESADEVTRTVERYRQLLGGQITGAELWRELKLINQLGVTRGQMETPARVLPRKS
ncbi:U32 family peptidase [Opitutus sp. GAS368]|uniref:U32 family peptidase n=1 Tax=Opitutus sp. GAS368 TaxID=1882749 RepID=UPI00087C51D8|nr:U32 family peptidase [Opitutus sp. GAS368]SDS28873.1 putative protease [Opitutus sp. GAS368]